MKLEKIIQGEFQSVVDSLNKELCQGKDAFSKGDVHCTNVQGKRVEMRSYEKYNLIHRFGVGINILFVELEAGQIELTVMITGENYGVLGLDLGVGEKTMLTIEEKLQTVTEDK